MVRKYFLESAIVIFEISRVVRTNGNVIMVNDNVQYSGEEVPVGLVLSDIAQTAGLETEHICTLGRWMGNGIQIMGVHDRKELCKYACIWRRV